MRFPQTYNAWMFVMFKNCIRSQLLKPIFCPRTVVKLRFSVASWAVFLHNWAVFSLLSRKFLLLRVAFFGLDLPKFMRFFGLFLLNIFLSKSIVFVDFAEVVRFVLT